MCLRSPLVRFSLGLLLALPVVAGGCRTRPWDLIRPDEVADAGPDLSLADLFVPPDFAPPADLILPKVCRSIYTVDSDGRFAGFEPRTLQFTDLPRLRCPTASTPQTMSVARDGTAWVFYSSHELFFVNTENSACRRSGFDTTQIENNSHYGSAFSADLPGDGESVYLALPGDTVYGNLDPATLKVRKFGAPGVVPDTGGELTGNSLGELWGFFPSSTASYVARIDKTTGAIVERHVITGINTDTAGFAFAFWGGAFWLFLYDASINGTTHVFRIDPTSWTATDVVPVTDRHIVGAGVSSCAPLGLDQ